MQMNKTILLMLAAATLMALLWSMDVSSLQMVPQVELNMTENNISEVDHLNFKPSGSSSITWDDAQSLSFIENDGTSIMQVSGGGLNLVRGDMYVLTGDIQADNNVNVSGNLTREKINIWIPPSGNDPGEGKFQYSFNSGIPGVVPYVSFWQQSNGRVVVQVKNNNSNGYGMFYVEDDDTMVFRSENNHIEFWSGMDVDDTDIIFGNFGGGSVRPKYDYTSSAYSDLGDSNYCFRKVYYSQLNDCGSPTEKFSSRGEAREAVKQLAGAHLTSSTADYYTRMPDQFKGPMGSCGHNVTVVDEVINALVLTNAAQDEEIKTLKDRQDTLITLLVAAGVISGGVFTKKRRDAS